MRLKFVVREAPDTLVVAANSENGGFIELWELREKSQPVHKLFQPKTLDPFKTVVCVSYKFIFFKYMFIIRVGF